MKTFAKLLLWCSLAGWKGPAVARCCIRFSAAVVLALAAVFTSSATLAQQQESEQTETFKGPPLNEAAQKVKKPPQKVKAVDVKLLAGINDKFKGLQKAWQDKIIPTAWKLLIVLMTVDFAWTATVWVLERKEMGEIFTGIAKKLLTFGFFGALLQNVTVWLPAIVGPGGLFQSMGVDAAGIKLEGTAKNVSLTPDIILGYGLAVISNVYHTWWDEMSILAPIVGTVSGVMIVGTCIVVALCFAIMSGQLLVTLVESYFVMGAGVFLLGFGGSRWTTDMAAAYIKYAVAVGMKIFVCYLVLGAGLSIFGEYTIDPNEMISSAWELLLQSIVFCFIAWSIPQFAASMISGSSSSTLGGALGSMAGAAVLAALPAAAATGAMKAGSAGLDQLKQAAGATGTSGSISGAGPGGPASGGDGGAIANGNSSGEQGNGAPTVGPARDALNATSAAKPELPPAAQDAQGQSSGGSSGASSGRGGDTASPASSAGKATGSQSGSASGGAGAATAAAKAGGGMPATSGAGTSNAVAQGDTAPPSSSSAAGAGTAAGASTGTGGGAAQGDTAPPASDVTTSTSDTSSSVAAAPTGTSSPISSPSADSSRTPASDTTAVSANTSTSPSASPAGDASTASASGGGDDKKSNAHPPQRSISDRIANVRQNFVAQDGANVQGGGISMGHTKD